GRARLGVVAKPALKLVRPSPVGAAPDPLRALARRAAEGDGDAIHALVMELGAGMLRTVRKVLGAQHPDAEDVTQDAVMGFVGGLARFRGECTVAHFAHQVALKRALHARRHFTTRDRVGEVDADIEERGVARGGSPLEAAISRERRRIVRELLSRLPEPTAEALALHFMLGYTVEEIAAVSEISPNTVWSRLKLGKRALKEALSRDRRLAELLREKLS